MDAALRAAAAMTGMELVFLSRITTTEFEFSQVLGEFPGIEEGLVVATADTLCARMLDGAAGSASADVAQHAQYAQAPIGQQLGISSYVGVPVVSASSGLIGTLCGIDRGDRHVDEATIAVLHAVADVVAAAIDGVPAVRLRRHSRGWVVETSPPTDPPTTDEVDDLPEGLTLADLLVDGLVPAPRPQRGSADATSELDRLRTQVRQLEHALAARVVVEQALGVLAERGSVTTREAFERLRRVARSQGRRVHELAQHVVASAQEPTTELPPELR